MKKYDLYIVDFDGTIIDSFEGLKTFYRATFGEIGYEVSDEECYNYTKMSLQEAYALKTNSDDPEMMKRFRKKCDEMVASRVLLKHNNLFEDTLPFVNYIKDNKVPCGIVTGNDLTHVNMVLNNHHINDFYSFMVTTNELTKQKPDPEGLLLLIKKSGYQGDKKNVCYIGDAHNDFLAAKAAGITPIMIDRHNELENNDEYLIIHDLMDLFN